MLSSRTKSKAGPSGINSPLLNSGPDSADLKMQNIVYVNNRYGRDEWVLKARRAWYYKRNETVYLDDVTAKFFARTGKTVFVKGDHGTYNTKSKDITLSGKVSAVSSDEERLYTSAITYNDAEHSLSTNEYVTMINRNLQVEGKGLLYDIATSKMSVTQDVRVLSSRGLPAGIE